MDKKILLIFLAIVALSVLDVLANIISFLPIIGDLAETASEFVMEALTILLAGILAGAAGMFRR